MSELREKLEALPASPGVYLMKGEGGRVLYVGKAKSLADRVRSYFHKSAAHGPRTKALLENVRDLEVMHTGSELEALILENNLIKKHRPKYNVILRDDKNYPFLRLGIKDPFPRLDVVRKIRRDGALYFGPYVPAGAMRETLKIIRKIFPLATCEIEIDGTAPRACIEFEIKRCMAPCTGNQSQAEYAEIVKDVRMFLEGKDRELLERMREQMNALSNEECFEGAALLRDKIWKVEQVLEKQRVTATSTVDQDVLALARDKGLADLQVLFIRGGMLIGRKDFPIEDPEDATDGEMIASFIPQFYSEDRIIPQEIISPASLPDKKVLEAWLRDRAGKAVRIVTPTRGKMERLLNLAMENARGSLAERLRVQEVRRDGSRILGDLLGLPAPPDRIEAFDISNIMGTHPTGSLVVWEGDGPKRSDYRHFKVRLDEGPNDFLMMREVVFRHYDRAKREGTRSPDLIVIDGGKGQLHAAQESLAALGLSDLPILGLAKAKGEKGERIFLPSEPEALVLEPSSPATHLLQRVRDESHRFAVTYHRKLRSKAGMKSALDDIPGVGKKRKLALLKHFGTVRKLAEADVEAIAAVPGIGKKAGRAVFDALHDPGRAG